MMNYFVLWGVLQFFVLTPGSASCDAGDCVRATSPALLQRKSEGQSQKIVMGGHEESLYDESLYGAPTEITGKFTLSYDMSVYQGTAEEVSDMQQKSLKAFQQALAVVLGDGIKDDDLVLHFEPVVALIQSKQRRERAEVVCFFTFPVPAGVDVATMEETVRNLEPEIISGALKSSLTEFGVPDTVEITSDVTEVHTTSDTSHSSSSPPPCDTPTGDTIEGSFHLSYEMIDFNPTQEEGERLKEAGREAVQEGLAHLIGHSLTGHEIHVTYESPTLLIQQQPVDQSIAVKVVFTFVCPKDIAPELMSETIMQISEEQLKTAMDDIFIVVGIHSHVLNLHVSPITSTWFHGVPSTTTTTPVMSTTTSTTTLAYTLEDVHPCKDYEDFMPNQKMSDYGWCEYDAARDNLSDLACLDAGCEAWGYAENAPFCHCPSEASCAAAGLTWKYHTCSSEMSAYMHGEYPSLIAAAREQGNCSGLETSWDQNIEDVLEWSARLCCSSWPRKLCDVDAELVTPCKDSSDWMPDNKVYQHSTETCKESLMNWWEQYTALETAYEQGSCDGLEFSWGETLAEWVRYPAWNCCSSRPASICEPDLKVVTPCKDSQDFKSDVVLSSYCEMASFNESTCAAAGCQSHETWCHCEASAPCEAAGGVWMARTCHDEFFKNEDFEYIRGLNEVENGAICEDVEIHGHPISSSINWAAEQCCSSWPASLCRKDLKKMTPCAAPSDFEAEKVMWAYCDFYSHGLALPNASVCQAQEGCRGDEYWCECTDESACTAVGGLWVSHSCGDEIDQWSTEQHELLGLAEEDGTCNGHLLHGFTKLEDVISWPAQTCCGSTYPSTICDKNVEKMTLCLRKEDFLPTHVTWAHCELWPSPEEDVCVAQGCTYQSDWSYCECSTKESCIGAGGFYWEGNCTSDTEWYSPAIHKGIKEAIEAGSCEGIEAGWGGLEQQIQWPGGQCCSTGKTVCEELSET